MGRGLGTLQREILEILPTEAELSPAVEALSAWTFHIVKGNPCSDTRDKEIPTLLSLTRALNNCPALAAAHTRALGDRLGVEPRNLNRALHGLLERWPTMRAYLSENRALFDEEYVAVFLPSHDADEARGDPPEPA